MTMKEQLNLFDNESDTAMYKHKITLEKIRNELINFGLTKSQAKVFIYLGKYGAKTASEISKALQLPRTETYHLVNSLQNLGLVTAELTHPTKYTAMEMKEAVTTLVKQEQDRIDTLAVKEESLSEMWDAIPYFAVETDESKSEKMQLLHGSGPISNKIKDMVSSSTESIKVLGSMADVLRMYYADVFDWVKDSTSELDIVISPSSQMPEFLSDLDQNKIRMCDLKTENKCFVINDSKEVLIFMRNANHPTRQIFAWWSDSDTLVDMMSTLFELSWEKGEKAY
ncbi:TrmB family transcriptional regulator [Nitrosopumilus cobalaminigenes]|uniref:TrmB family transcriptional regulator n=2 Tax=Nitrosopumilus cobalaminigenes TaxID=1470066 RepID=A0A7D5M276_9ARCH|nr:TrmB family transcriptional regulator [Nitrosopumilus cobalaminigenes]